MNNRLLLYAAFSLVLFMIWQQWKIEQIPPTEITSAGQKDERIIEDLPEEEAFIAEPKSIEKTKPAQVKNIDENIVLYNEDIKITVGLLGGSIKRTELLNYFKTISENSENIKLLDFTDEYYVAQSGLLHDKKSTNKELKSLAPNHHELFSVKSKNNQSLVLEWENKGAKIKVLKKIYLDKSGYIVHVKNTVINNSNRAWIGRQYRQIRRQSNGEGRSWVAPTFTGGAYYDEAYNKISYEEISEEKPKFNVINGWVAMMEHYFVSSWVFSGNKTNLFYTKEILVDDVRNDYIIGARSESVLIQPNEKGELSSKLYVGPKLQIELEKIAPGLELTIDYGVLTFLSKPLFWLLNKIHTIVGNWGWAIILLTLIIKLVFYKLSETSYRSMAKMKKFSPKIQSIKERFGDDRQKMNQAMMAMYREEKINPLGGCWPILIQIPVFIALYWVLLESVELRHADFIFWINDLSAKDPYFVLPLIMGASMFFQQKLNPAPPDPVQAKVMQMLPIIFTAFFAFFPSGLVLYWVVNNLLSIAQQWKITKSISST
jgi:YidC/Oxa1 family membrane protein insertase